MSQEFIPTIGIECHVQFKTQSKLFSSAANDARNAQPNTLINHIDLGLPGALPTFNEQALKLAILAGFSLNSRPQLVSYFDRKHYFYPDLPMGYQITQFEKPIILGGFVEFEVANKLLRVGITRAHIEADAGKSSHPAGQDYSLVDLNRAGTPLLEIVSEPDMHSAQEARAYAHELYLLMRYADVTYGDLFQGNMRFDVNVSLSSTPGSLGTRTETKNLNSFRSVEKAVDYEIKRQTDLLRRGQKVVQATLGWDDAKQRTFTQRVKENADDYRYMPDPDLPPVILTDSYLDEIASSLPMGPKAWRLLLKKIGLTPATIEVLLEANLDLNANNYLQLINNFSKTSDTQLAKLVANWLVNVDIPYCLENKTSDKLDRLKFYTELSQLILANKLNSTSAKELITDFLSGKLKLTQNLAKLIEDLGLIQSSNQTELMELVRQVLEANPQAVADIRAGQAKAKGYLIGQAMKLNNQANPGLVAELIDKLIK